MYICYTAHMDTNERRREIIIQLTNSNTPISASTLAEHFSVSRQIIVGDVALLRAEGHDIVSTPRGYLLKASETNFPYIGLVACRHDSTKMRNELYTIVDFGGTVIDVTIEHSIYGEISGLLNLSSRYEVDMFVKSVSGESDKPLSTISGGIHLHKIGCKSEEIFNLIKEKLKEQEILL